jgi:3',5'-cyclic AMP phosphodiesterase CpdA
MADRLTIIQVSDTHLSRTHAWFAPNWPVFLEEAKGVSPDFIVNSGDLAFNGPDNADDLAYARACHEKLGAPWRAIAGNHDVGEAPVASRLQQPVNDARLQAWRDNFGTSWWTEDLQRGAARLRLIGLDSALMGSGHEDESRQIEFLEKTLAERDGRTVIVFTHMPPFGDDADDEKITTHCILPEPRRWLLARCLEAGVAAIASGHIHRYSSRDHRGMAIVTAPSSSFVNIPASPPADLTDRRIGYLIWELDGAGLRHHFIRPRLFMSTDASNWTEENRTTTNLPPRPLS